MKALKIIQIILTTAFLFTGAACSSGGDSGSQVASPAPVPKPKLPDDNPEPSKIAVTWGQVECQKTKSCDDHVLNLSFKQWGEILDQANKSVSKQKQESSVEIEHVALDCGVAMFKAFSGSTDLNRELNDSERSQVVKFAARTMDLETCSVKSSLKKNMDNYLNEAVKAQDGSV